MGAGCFGGSHDVAFRSPEPEAGTCSGWSHLHLARTNTPESDPVLTK